MFSYLLDGKFIEAVIYLLSAVVTVFLVLPFHEFAHAFVAKKLGDRTQEYQGRTTLNPFAHIDWIGAGLIVMFGFGWAKPVQVNPFYFKNRKWGMALTALAGPVANVIAALVAMLISNVFAYFFGSMLWCYYVYRFLRYLALINVGLAVFNLIPAPPLDGSRILFAVFPDRIYDRIMYYERYLMIIVIVAVVTGVLDKPLSYLDGALYAFLDTVTSWPFSFLP